MGDGGTRWGNPPPTRAIMGEPAPNAVLYGGYREAIVGEPAPNAGYREAIERLLWGYCGAIERLLWGYREAIERFIIYLD